VNLLDRAIGYVAPRVALKRVRARAALDASRVYAGAALGRHTDGWRAGSTSADQEIEAAGPRLRDRHRDLVRNNPHAASAVSSWVTNLVGEGITPRCQDKRVLDLFNAWAKRCDADGQLDFYGLQVLAVRQMVEAGEVLVRRRRRRKEDGLPVPLQLQVLESDHLDSLKTATLASGNRVTLGVETDAIGRRVAYWLFPEHPGSLAPSPVSRTVTSTPIAAVDVIHLYEGQRKQTRGVAWGAAVIRKLRDLDDYDFAEGIRKKTESAYVGALLVEDDNDDGIAPRFTDVNGKAVEQLEPGLLLLARGGKDLKFNAPAAVSGYAEYYTVSLRTIAAGYRLPYELVSGDLSRVNYSSIRAGMLEFRRLVRMMQWQLVIPTFCQRVWDWFCETAFLAGLIESPDVPVEWDTPRFEWVDPLKDVQADIAAVRAGIRSMPEVIAERGRNPDDVIAEAAEFNAKADAAGLVLDTDPRKVAGTGALQAAKPDGTEQDDEGEDEPAPSSARGLQVVR
jgi:lambda family phage portal protein